MTAKDYIAQARLDEAFDLLTKQLSGEDARTLIILKARYTQFKREKMQGILYPQEERVQNAAIVDSLLSLADKVDSTSSSQSNQSQMSSKDSLIKIMSDYRRYKTLQDTKEYGYYHSAETLLSDIEKHVAKKQVEPTYDVTGRAERALNTQYLELMESLKETKLDNKEDFAQAIALKLGEDIPSWKDIESAYKLCVGRGMNNSRVATAIAAKPTDMQSKIECADIIENWVANYLR